MSYYEKTESEEIADTIPSFKTFKEACEHIEKTFPQWREYWGMVQHDNIAESMVRG